MARLRERRDTHFVVDDPLIDTRAELLQLFDEAWRKMRDAFYDANMHGVDWNRVRETYRPVVSDLTYKEDFYALFALALGELNASHTGLAGPPSASVPSVPSPTTASLGIALDDTYPGPGVRVGFVMPKGPAARPANGGKRDGSPLRRNGSAAAPDGGAVERRAGGRDESAVRLTGDRLMGDLRTGDQ